MRHRRLLAALLLISAGCASRAPVKQNEQTLVKPTAKLSHEFQNANQRESLSLDQIGSTPLMPGPTTRSGQPPIESVRLFAQARIAMHDNDRDGAISYLQKAVALDPASFELHVELADQYDAANNPLALVEYQKAAAIEPNHLDLLIDIARHQISSDKPEDAVKQLRLAQLTDEYLADDPSSAEADFLLAQALQDADYDRAAIEVYEKLLNRLQTQSRIVARNAQGDALLRHPAVLAIHVAALYEKHRQYDEALAVLRSAAARAPNEFALSAQIVRDTSAGGQRQDAITTATDLVTRFHADDASVALLREICGDPNQTQLILQNLIQKQQSNPSLYGALADLQAANGRPADAAQTLITALARWPDDLRLIRRRVNQLRALGDFSAAAKLIAEQIARRPMDDLELETIFDPLTRPSAHGRLRTREMRGVQVSASAAAAKLLLVAHCAAVDRGDAAQRKVLDEAVDATP